jgi:hypothetical protein
MNVWSVLAPAGWVVSPTRKIIDHLKDGDSRHRGYWLRKWSLGLFVFEVLGLILLAAFCQEAPARSLGVVSTIAFLYGFSRANEIAYAFYADSLDAEKQSDLSSSDRIRMAMRSYFGLTFNFALIYFFFPFQMTFSTELNGFFEAFYFSGVTAATLGYGDLYPTGVLARILSLYEVALGLLLLAVAIATYAGDAKKNDP